MDETNQVDQRTTKSVYECDRWSLDVLAAAYQRLAEEQVASAASQTSVQNRGRDAASTATNTAAATPLQEARS